jgi:hypothetical protein
MGKKEQVPENFEGYSGDMEADVLKINQWSETA